MAMANCNECGMLMSDQAHACRNCGYPIAADPGTARAGWRDIALVGTIASIWILIGVMVIQT